MSNLKPPIYELGSDFYDLVSAATFPKTILRYRNQDAAAELGLASISDTQWLQHFAHFTPLQDNIESPLALRYHGHQFMHYNPDLGDGRGFLFAQLISPSTYRLLDLGTKGSGQTPYSRRGDGRLTLKGAVREALATAYLEVRGVPTSRTFSVVETGESLIRHDEPSPTRAAVLVRLNHSHIRFGTFQRLAYFKDTENIRKLVHYTVKYYFPDLINISNEHLGQALLNRVSEVSAKKIASWMMAGFVHGVMNTDNMNITGESFDYGPYRFLPTYDPNFTAAYFDSEGLYRFGRQPATMVWNLDQLAKALQVAYQDISIPEALEPFGEYFQNYFEKYFFARLFLKPDSALEAHSLIAAFFQFAEQSQAPFEQLIFDLSGGHQRSAWTSSPSQSFYKGSEWTALLNHLRPYKSLNLSREESDYLQQDTPETLLYKEIESIWEPIATNDDWGLFDRKIKRLEQLKAVAPSIA